MNQISKKKITREKPQNTSVRSFKFSRGNRIHEPPATLTPPVLIKPKNSVTKRSEQRKELVEYSIYKKLKEEVGEFFPYPGLWLEAPHALLGGRTPLEVALASQEGSEFILDMVESIKAGHFS